LKDGKLDPGKFFFPIQRDFFRPFAHRRLGPIRPI
jgi:hypothetical protein